MLKTDIRKLPTGEWQQLVIECDGHRAVAKIVSTGPYRLALEWEADKAIKIYREPKHEEK